MQKKNLSGLLIALVSGIILLIIEYSVFTPNQSSIFDPNTNSTDKIRVNTTNDQQRINKKVAQEVVPQVDTSAEVAGRDNEFELTINKNVKTFPDRKNVVIVFKTSEIQKDFFIESQFISYLNSDSTHFILNYFKDSFKTMGYFDTIFEGDTSILKRAGVMTNIDYLILGKLNFSFRTSTYQDLISCDINFSFIVINKFRQIVGNKAISVVGPGFDKNSSLEQGIKILIRNHKGSIFELIS